MLLTACCQDVGSGEWLNRAVAEGDARGKISRESWANSSFTCLKAGNRILELREELISCEVHESFDKNWY